MLRKTPTFSRLLLVAVVAAAVGCSADNGKKISEQPTGPVAPTGVAVTVTASRTSLTASSEATSTITVRAIRTESGAPIPDYTNITLTTTLGAFDSPSGGNSVTLPSINGAITATFFPGDVEGTARLNASVLGAIGIATITIRPAVEVIPPPTASTLAISSDTVSVSDETPTSFIGVTATVLGSNLKPFKKAPVYFSVNPAIGLFNSSGGTVGDVIPTNSAGQASDVLVVSGADLGSVNALTITATLTVEGGGTITTSVSITVTHAPQANGIQLFLVPDATVDDDGTPQAVTLQAKVTDNQNPPQPISGVTVTFQTGLGTLNPSNTDVTDGSGIAQVVLDLTAGQLANFCLPTFQVSASYSGGTANGTITISRAPLTASFSYVAVSVNDVSFTDTSTGSPDAWDWDFNNDGAPDLTVQNPANIDLVPYGWGAGNTKTVRLVTHRGACTSKTALQSVTVP